MAIARGRELSGERVVDADLESAERASWIYPSQREKTITVRTGFAEFGARRAARRGWADPYALRRREKLASGRKDLTEEWTQLRKEVIEVRIEAQSTASVHLLDE